MRAIGDCGLNLLQFHGDETPEYCAQFGLMSMKAFRIRDVESLKALPAYPTEAWLLDAFVKGKPGGTGKIQLGPRPRSEKIRQTDLSGRWPDFGERGGRHQKGPAVRRGRLQRGRSLARTKRSGEGQSLHPGGERLDRIDRINKISGKNSVNSVFFISILGRESTHESSDQIQRARRQGHFGPYGGRFVPETLMHPLQELEDEYFRAEGSGISTRTRILSQRILRTADAAVLRRTADARTRRRENLSQARRPAPHRRAQDQQRHRPGAARAAHEQDPHHRRDRRRPARRRHGHRAPRCSD